MPQQLSLFHFKSIQGEPFSSSSSSVNLKRPRAPSPRSLNSSRQRQQAKPSRPASSSASSSSPLMQTFLDFGQTLGPQPCKQCGMLMSTTAADIALHRRFCKSIASSSSLSSVLPVTTERQQKESNEDELMKTNPSKGNAVFSASSGCVGSNGALLEEWQTRAVFQQDLYGLIHELAKIQPSLSRSGGGSSSGSNHSSPVVVLRRWAPVPPVANQPTSESSSSSSRLEWCSVQFPLSSLRRAGHDDSTPHERLFTLLDTLLFPSLSRRPFDVQYTPQHLYTVVLVADRLLQKCVAAVGAVQHQRAQEPVFFYRDENNNNGSSSNSVSDAGESINIDRALEGGLSNSGLLESVPSSYSFTSATDGARSLSVARRAAAVERSDDDDPLTTTGSEQSPTTIVCCENAPPPPPSTTKEGAVDSDDDDDDFILPAAVRAKLLAASSSRPITLRRWWSLLDITDFYLASLDVWDAQLRRSSLSSGSTSTSPHTAPSSSSKKHRTTEASTRQALLATVGSSGAISSFFKTKSAAAAVPVQSSGEGNVEDAAKKEDADPLQQKVLHPVALHALRHQAGRAAVSVLGAALWQQPLSMDPTEWASQQTLSFRRRLLTCERDGDEVRGATQEEPRTALVELGLPLDGALQHDPSIDNNSE